MTGLTQDFRYALRQLRKSPGFATVAIVTLTLGIGVNTAIFNVIEAVVLRSLPFADADRLVWLNGKMPQTDDAGVSPADFLDYRDANRSFEQMAGISQSVMAGRRVGRRDSRPARPTGRRGSRIRSHAAS